MSAGVIRTHGMQQLYARGLLIFRRGGYFLQHLIK